MRDAGDEAEFRALTARIVDLERETTEAQQRARMLDALQSAIASLAASRSCADIVERTLRTAVDVLGFSRAAYFETSASSELLISQSDVDRQDLVERTAGRLELYPTRIVREMLSRERATDVGRAGELSVPTVDVRRWYVLASMRRGDGTSALLYVDGHASPTVRSTIVELVERLATIAAVAIENSVLFAKTQELACRDPLTGLLNRRAFAERLFAEIEGSRRGGRSLAYVLIDLDDFKQINDRRGHAYGDAVLRNVGDTLRRCSRTEDVVGRYAGDEFVTLLVNLNPDLAHVLVSRLSRELRERAAPCSIGAALFPRDGDDAASLLAAADRALYATKRRGKDGFSFAQWTDVKQSPLEKATISDA
jgi:diguanylate cyclase (GGDEF)-like protein